MAENWLSIIAKRSGLSPDEYREKQRRERHGCVIRALESISGQKATEQEWQQRLTQIEEIEKKRHNLEPLAQFAADCERVKVFIKKIKTTGSPIGMYLKNREIDMAVMNTEEIKTAIATGTYVLSMGIIRNGTGIGAHAAHLDFQPDKGFVSKSDSDWRIQIGDKVHIQVVLFKKM